MSQPFIMGDVEEGEIVEADNELKSPRPSLMDPSPCSPEIGQKNDGSFWLNRRGIESFDYNHGRWMDRQMISARRQERYEGANMHECNVKNSGLGQNERKSDKVQHSDPDYYHREERPYFDTRFPPQQRHIRGSYFGRKRRFPPQRGGRGQRREHPRDRFRNNPREMAVNDVQCTEPWQVGHFQIRRHEHYHKGVSPQILSENEGFLQHRRYDPYHNRQHPVPSESSETFVDRFERVDKTREENLRLNEKANMMETTEKVGNDGDFVFDEYQQLLEHHRLTQQQVPDVGEKEGDSDYNLNEYQLLLERYRLIQQHLTAIGEKERSLQERVEKEDGFAESSDFEVIPNPNSPRENVAIGCHQIKKSNFYQNFDTGLQIEQSGKKEEGSCLEDKQTFYDHGSQASTQNPTHLGWVKEPGRIEMHNNTSIDSYKGSSGDLSLGDVDSSSYQNRTLSPPPATTKSKKSRRRERRKKSRLKQNLKTLQSAHSQGKQSNLLVSNTAEQNTVYEEPPMGKERRNSVARITDDNYQSVPMDIEEEYEEIDSFHEDDHHPGIVEESQEDGRVNAVSEPQLQEKEANKEIASKDELTSETRQHADIRPEEKGVKSGSEDDMEDDLLLREQLLQSLATKRAEKAKAIIADQQAKLTTPITLKAADQSEESKQKQEGLVSKSSSQFSSLAKAPSVSSLRTNNEKRDNNNVKHFDRYLAQKASEPHPKFVIQIGAESDSDDDHELQGQKNGDTFGGAINDLIREARHGTESPVENQSAVSEGSKTEKENVTKPDELHHKTLELCISKANRRLAVTRGEIIKETNAIKLLQKKLALRKTRIEQQDARIKKLQHLLATAEKTKNTLNVQCGAFEAEIKLIVNRIKLQTDKNKTLEEELQRAKAVISAASSNYHLSNCSKEISYPQNTSPVKADRNAGVEPKPQLAEQISGSIAAMKSVLSKHEKSLSVPLVKDRKSLRTNQAKVPSGSNKVSTNSTKPFRRKSENTLLNERERLQKLELELRQKLDSMKKLSEAKQRVLGKAGPKQNTKIGKMDLGLQKRVNNSLPNDLSKNAPSSFTESLNLLEDRSVDAVTSTSNSRSLTNASKTVSETDELSEQNQPNFMKSFDTDVQNDLRLVIENRVENKLSTLFQNQDKLKQIMQDQLDREAKIPDLDAFHPHMISDLIKKETGEKEHECFNDIILPDGKIREQARTSNDVKAFNIFSTYTSPLLLFRSYRLSPWFRTKEKKSVKSGTFSNQIKPMDVICPYDSTGTCLDNECKKQHISNTSTLKDDQLLIDLIQYEPKIANITPNESPETKNKKIDSFIARLKQKYTNKISNEQLALLLINDVQMFCKQKQKLKIFNIRFEKRQQYVQPEERPEEKILFNSQTRILEQQRLKQDLGSDKAESQEVRYFEEHYDIKSTLEKSVNENPWDIKSWLLLAKQIASDSTKDSSDQSSSNREDKALNVLSKALEANPHSEDLWILYLDIFSQRKNSAESREMYIQALEYCRSYTIWWKCLELENHYDDKMEICLDIIDFLREYPEDLNRILKSHRLLETLLFMVKLAMMRGRKDLAFASIQSVLGLPMEKVPFDLPVLIDDLTVGDFVIAWLSLISLLAFNQLPPLLFDPSVSGPSRIVQKNVGIFVWSKCEENLFFDIRQLFEDAIKTVDESKGLSNEDLEAVVQLYENYIQFEIEAGQIENAVKIATQSINALSNSSLLPASVASSVTISSSTTSSSTTTSSPTTSSPTMLSSKTSSSVMSSAMSIMIIKIIMRNLYVLKPETISKLDHLVMLKTDECVYEYAKYLLKTNTSDHAIRLLVDSVSRKFDFSEIKEDMSLEIGFKAEAISLYRRLLGCSTTIAIGALCPKKIAEIDKRSREYAFTWLNFCLLQELTGSVPNSDIFLTGAEEAFESAVNTYTTRENREILWLEYLSFKERQITRSSVKRESVKSFFDAAKRCLASMPTSRVLPHQVTMYWDDCAFHNTVISKCLQFLPKSDEIEYVKGNFALMPANISLALRLCRAVLIIGSFEEARTIYGIALEIYPYSLEMWKMAISVELQNKKIREARWLYEEATRMLPYCTSLWEDFVLFEIGHCRDTKQIQTRFIEIATKATSYGMPVLDYVRSLLK